MATTYALPSTLNGHTGAHHGHSHSRKAAIQRNSLQYASVNNGGYQMNAGPTIDNQLRAEMLPQHQAHKSAGMPVETHRKESFPTLQLPSPHPSFSTPTGARSKSMERRKSAGLPTHLHLGDGSNEYGYAAPTANQRFRATSIGPGESIKSITITEAISSILVPLPYVLTSLTLGALLAAQSAESNKKGLFRHASLHLQARQEWPIVCTITSITLVTVGLKGKIWQPPAALDRRKKSLAGIEDLEKPNWSVTARRILGRILSVGLPFYATSQLGAARVGLVMLVGLASNIIAIDNESTDLTKAQGWKRLLSHRRWTLASIILQILCDLSGLTIDSRAFDIWLGYFALGLSVLFLPPPFPSSRPKSSVATSSGPVSESKPSAVFSTPWQTPGQVEPRSPKMHMVSPMISSQQDVDITLWGGLALLMFSLTVNLLYNHGQALSMGQLFWNSISGLAAAVVLTAAEPKSLRSNKGLGLVLGSLTSSLALTQMGGGTWGSFSYQSILVGIAFAALKYDIHRASSLSSHSNHHHHHHAPKIQAHEYGQMSRFSAKLVSSIPQWPLLHSILVEKDSRRIFYFMCLNFAFMLVQTFYGLVTGSLGLLSDSIHMFFDCLALVVGLCAAVMSKWPPSERFPYGYGKMDTLAGFANGIFLMLISVEIIYEAIERLAEGDHINKIGELLTVSSLGLVVNIVGMTAFGHAHHGHGHSHGGHDHGGDSHADHDHAGHNHGEECSHDDHSNHDHSHHDHSHHNHSHNGHDHSPPKHTHPLSSVQTHNHHLDHLSTGPSPSPSVYSSFPATPSKPVHSHSHAHGHGSHGHGHHHGNENMEGIYLHVLADTLGSVAVVISTVLIHYTGWSGFDPLASCLIAILIFLSAVPLVKSSARTLLLTVPDDTEYDLREALAGLAGLRGVVGYAVPKFWLEAGENRKVLGVIHVIAGKGTDLEDVRERAVSYLNGRHMDVVVQVEREGNDRCWCQAGK